jgi:hypothetical protein
MWDIAVAVSYIFVVNGVGKWYNLICKLRVFGGEIWSI